MPHPPTYAAAVRTQGRLRESTVSGSSGMTVTTAGDLRPELADVGRLARRVVRRTVAVARSEDAPAQRLVRRHFGSQARALALVRGSWPPYEQVNVQVGLDAWLASPSRQHDLLVSRAFITSSSGWRTWQGKGCRIGTCHRSEWAASPPPPARRGQVEQPAPVCNAAFTWSATTVSRWPCCCANQRCMARTRKSGLKSRQLTRRGQSGC